MSNTTSLPGTRVRRGVFARVRKFLGDVVAELGRVTWPTRAQTVRFTGVVLTFLVIMVALIGGADAGIAAVTTRVFG